MTSIELEEKIKEQKELVHRKTQSFYLNITTERIADYFEFIKPYTHRLKKLEQRLKDLDNGIR